MKFKVEPKDFFLFIVYCILLLYLCALAVANFFSLINTGSFSGLFPIEAFRAQYFPVTIILFFGILIFIFTSVSSYIFGKEKGKGFGLKVKEKEDSNGYARWANDKEIKTSSNVEKVNPSLKELDAAGIPLINNGKEMWVDNGSYHNLVIGSTGSGKTENLIFPMVNILAKKGESMVITDPKGEIYRKTAKNLEERGYRIIVLNFREPSKGNSWNPLALPYQYYKENNKDKAIELLDDVALNILYDPNNKNDPFWERSSADYFAGLALGLFQDANESEINLNSINYMSTVGEERYATGNFIKEYFTLKGPESSPYIFASGTINAPNDTKNSILSTFRQKIRRFSTQENLSEMLSHSDFDMRDIGNGKTAVFMIIHDEKKTYHSLMTIFIKQVYETLIDVAQGNGGKLKYRTNFILDEFANMPPLNDVDSMVSAARSRDIRFTFVIQNFAQLNDVYGEEIAQVIRGNCGNLVYLISTELAALKEISEMCGEVKVKDKKKDKEETRPLVTVTDLQKLKLGEAIIIRLRMSPFKTKYTPNFKMNWGEDYPEASYPDREVKPVDLFDLKKYVIDEKNKQMMSRGENVNGNMMNNMMNPFAMPNPEMFYNRPSPMPRNPFIGNMNNIDIDSMIKDIDKQLQEMEEEKKKRQDKMKNQNKETIELETDFDKLLDEEIAKNSDIESDKAKVTEKPKINVDVDSVIVNENVITDDEFFDDFFGDNE